MQLACEKSIKCRKLIKQPKMNSQKSTSSFVLKRDKSKQCTTTATVQYIITKILQKYSEFSFYNTVYSAHNENEVEYPDIDMCIGEPLV